MESGKILKLLKLQTQQIKFVKEYYPRFEEDNNIINQYRLNIDALPPILITKDNILVDGYHRLLAHKVEGRTEITCDVIDIKNEEILKVAIRRNSAHGQQLKPEEKKLLAVRLYRNTSEEEIASLLAVSIGHVKNWLIDTKSKERDERNTEILRLYLQCWTHEDIAEKFGLSRQNVTQIIDNAKNSENLKNLHKPPESLQVYNIWKFPKLSDGQLKYPGQLPEELYENLLWYYTKPFDVVYEPTAGSGTLSKVAEHMYRRYQLSDINPLKDPIREHDITTGFPDWLIKPNLVFLDPPYWKQKEDDYIKHQNNLALLKLQEYHDAIDKIILDAKRILKTDGIFALIMGPTQEKGQIYDHAFKIYQTLEKQKFKFIQRIIIPYSTQQAKAFHVSDAKKQNYMLKLYRDLLVFQR